MRLLITFWLICSHQLFAQDLGNHFAGSSSIVPSGYSIVGVLDSTIDATGVTKSSAIRVFPYSVKMHESVTKLLQGAPVNGEELKPYLAVVQKFSVYDQKISSYSYKGQLEAEIDFYSLYDGDTILVYEGTGGGEFTYGKKEEAFKNIGTFCSQVTESIARRFDGFIQKNKNAMIDFNTGSEIRIKPFRKDAIADTVFYNRGAINWELFQGSPKGQSRYTASIFPGFAFESSLELKNGKLVASIEPYVYMLPKMSWVKKGGNTAYALAHEQLHFDIAYLSCKKMIAKVKDINTTSFKDLQSIIQYEYLMAYQGMNRLQVDYDSETRHGLNVMMQKEWSNRIKREIESLD